MARTNPEETVRARLYITTIDGEIHDGPLSDLVTRDEVTTMEREIKDLLVRGVRYFTLESGNDWEGAKIFPTHAVVSIQIDIEPEWGAVR